MQKLWISTRYFAYTKRYHFSTNSSSLGGLMNKLQDLSNKKSPQNLIQKNLFELRPFISQMQFEQLRNVAIQANKIQYHDEAFATKSFNRISELVLSNQIQVSQSLSFLDLILSSSEKYSDKFYQNVINFLAAVACQPELTPEQIAYVTLNYGLTNLYTQKKVKSIESDLTIHIQQQIDQFSSNDLKNLALGVCLGQFKNINLLNLIDRQVCNTEMDYEHIARIASVFVMEEKGSLEFWKIFEEKTIKYINEQDPSIISMVVLCFKQTTNQNEEIYNELAKAFLTKYEDFTKLEKVVTYSGFGSIEWNNPQLWEYFKYDLRDLLEEKDLNATTLMVGDCLNVIHYLDEETIALLLTYVVFHGPKMNQSIRDEIYDKLNAYGLLNEDLETALLGRS